MYTFVGDPDDTFVCTSRLLLSNALEVNRIQVWKPHIECEFSHATLVECANC